MNHNISLMDTSITDKLIISLIKDDLINTKLVNGLIDLGLDAGAYYLHLDNTIFKLVGYANDSYSEEIYQQYRDLAASAKHIDISQNNVGLDSLAMELFLFLVLKKQIV